MELVGVDLGGTKILARLVDPDTGRAAGRSKLPTPKTSPEGVLEAVVRVVLALPDQAEATAIGLGMPGPVVEGRLVGPCPNLPGWSGVHDIAGPLSERLGRPVVVANDVNCGVLAEHRVGAARGFDDVLAVFVGTGVGGGLILGGELMVGSRGMAGEIGHLTVFPGGRLCGCGQRGHLEAYAGRAGIEREARARVAAGARSILPELAGGGAIKSRHLLSASTNGDEMAIDLLADAADALAVAIGSVATALDVPMVVLGGGVVDKLGADFVGRIQSSELFGGHGPASCDLVEASRIDDAGAVGAAIAAMIALGPGSGR